MKLQIKIFLQILLVTLAVTSVYIYFQFTYEKDKLLAETDELHRAMVQNAITPLANSLWEMDESAAKATLQPLFHIRTIKSVQLFDDKGALFVGFRVTTPGVSTPAQKRFRPLIKEKKTALNLAPLEAIAPKNQPDKLDAIQLTATEKRLVSPAWYMKDGDEKKLVGYFVLEYSTASVDEKLKDMFLLFVYWSFGFALIKIVLMLIFLGKSVITPISMLANASVRIAQGDFVKIQTPPQNDEIGALTTSFNHMVGSVEALINDIRLLAKEGEQISQQKTYQTLYQQIVSSMRNISGKSRRVYFYVAGEYDTFHDEEQFILYFDESNPSPHFDKTCSQLASSVEGYDKFAIHDDRGLIAALYVEKMTENLRNIHASVDALLVYVKNTVNNLRYIEEQKSQERMAKEIEATSIVQSQLIPTAKTFQFGPFLISSFFKPADQCGGDWWSTYHLNDGRYLFIIGDVTGHGISSAFITAIVKGYCDSLPAQINLTPTKILTDLDCIVSQSSGGGKWMTMFAMIFDETKKEMVFANAAHNFPYVIRYHDDQVEVDQLVAAGNPLGSVFPSKEKLVCEHEYRYQLQPRETFLLFTDGLIEGVNEKNAIYGEKRLYRLIKKYCLSGQEASAQIISDDAYDFYGKAPQDDDITLVMIHYNENQIDRPVLQAS